MADGNPQIGIFFNIIMLTDTSFVVLKKCKLLLIYYRNLMLSNNEVKKILRY